LPEDEAALWDWLLAQDSAIVSSLIAHCPPVSFRARAGIV
jgi:hypothetical protein